MPVSIMPGTSTHLMLALDPAGLNDARTAVRSNKTGPMLKAEFSDAHSGGNREVGVAMMKFQAAQYKLPMEINRLMKQADAALLIVRARAQLQADKDVENRKPVDRSEIEHSGPVAQIRKICAKLSELKVEVSGPCSKAIKSARRNFAKRAAALGTELATCQAEHLERVSKDHAIPFDPTSLQVTGEESALSAMLERIDDEAQLKALDKARTSTEYRQVQSSAALKDAAGRSSTSETELKAAEKDLRKGWKTYSEKLSEVSIAAGKSLDSLEQDTSLSQATVQLTESKDILRSVTRGMDGSLLGGHAEADADFSQRLSASDTSKAARSADTFQSESPEKAGPTGKDDGGLYVESAAPISASNLRG